MSSNVAVNQACVDWLTVTSYDKLLTTVGENISRDETDTYEEASYMQYAGLISRCAGGSVFFGGGMQGGREHYMVRLSGWLADKHAKKFQDMISLGVAKVTRIDYQVTVEESAYWNQAAFLNRAEKNVRTVSFMRSETNTGTENATVAIGARRSATYTRVYEKDAKGSSGKPVKLLRMEVEYKREKTGVAYAFAMKGRASIAGALRRRVRLIGDAELAREFSCLQDHEEVKIVSIKNETDKRREWLLTAVAPALDRYMRETKDTHVRREFLRILED